MSSLNEIISRNARLALIRARQTAKKEGEKFSKLEVSRRMAGAMGRHEGDDPNTEENRKQTKSIDRHLTDLLASPPRRKWRSDYLEAFAGAVGGAPERLVALSYDGSGKISDATHAQYLATALGRQLQPKQAQRIIRNLKREMRIPGMFDLISDIAETILAAETQDIAMAGTSKIILKCSVWNEKEEVVEPNTKADK